MEQDGGEPIAVTAYMMAPVHTIHESERLVAADRSMRERAVSALPVVDDTGQIGGVVTRDDLLRIGRTRERGRARALDLPDQRLREHASGPIEVVACSATLAEVAHRMLRRQVRHVYVAQSRVAEGVVTSREMMRAVADLRFEHAAGELVDRAAVVTVHAEDPLGLALDRLLGSPHGALVVVDGPWPVGIFGQREALEAKDASTRTPVDAWMSPSFVCVAADLPAHRAAARAAATGPRALLVSYGPEVLGILTGADFARLLST